MRTPTPTGPELVALRVVDIIESPDNPRRLFSAAFIDELAASLRSVGQLTPCLVRPIRHAGEVVGYELAAGATRWRAAKQAGLERLLCVLREMDDATFLEALTFENLKRRDLQPMEEARAYALLQKRLEGWTVEKIAERSGVSAAYVRDRLRLTRLVPAVATLLEEGRLHLAHALELAKLRPDQQQEMVDADAWDGGLWREAEGGLLPGDDEDGRRELVSARELRASIAERFPVDLADVPEIFPEMAQAIAAAETDALVVVRISTAYQAPKALDGEAPILGNRHWCRADGTKGHKKCKHATQLGVVVHGHEWRGEAFRICTATTVCRTHFGEEIDYAERLAKAKAAAPDKPKGEEPWVKRQRLEREAKARFKPAIPAIRQAIARAIAAAPTKLGGPLDKLVQRGRQWQKPTKDGIGRGTTPEDLMRYLAWREVEGNQWAAHTELPRIGKLLGVNVAAIVKAHTKTATKKKPAAKKAATKTKAVRA